MLGTKLLSLTAVTLGVICVAMSAVPAALSAQQPASSTDRTDAAIAAMIMHESRNAYYATGHPCACPDDLMRNGRRCGGTSAYIRPGGAHPLCSATDVPPEMIQQYRARSGRN